jgi:hypothetical protein
MTVSAENEEVISFNRSRIRSQNDSNIRTLGVYTIFTASGAAGLIYQVIWGPLVGHCIWKHDCSSYCLF